MATTLASRDVTTSRRSTHLTGSVVATVLMLAAPLHAQPTEPAEASTTGAVTIIGARELPLVSYRIWHDAVTAVEKARAELGPNARVIFTLRARPNVDRAAPPPQIHIVGTRTDTDIAIDLGSDGVVIIPFTQALYDEDPEFRIQNADGLTYAISTPGIAANAIRLGDARLGCVFFTSLHLHSPRFFERAMTRLFGTAGCDVTFPVQPAGPAPVVSFGNRHETLKIRKSQYDVPVHDRDWPNDSMIEFGRSQSPKVESGITP